MAVTMEMRFPGTREQYEQIVEKAGGRDNVPKGLIVHTTAQDGDQLKTIDVWESVEDFEAFNNDVLGPAVAEVMGAEAAEAAEGGPEPQITEVFDVIKP